VEIPRFFAWIRTESGTNLVLITKGGASKKIKQIV